MRIRVRMPSHTTVAAYLALFIAMSGTAYAATGGTFILGKRNTASTMSKLRNPSGTPLKLVPRAGYAPLRVTSGVRVANLNADRLDGLDASAFLRTAGKAANSETLDGMDSSAFLSTSSSTSFQKKLAGGAILSHSFCPSGTFAWGSVQLSSSFGTTSTWEVCSIF
jgi:hypothetical protein